MGFFLSELTWEEAREAFKKIQTVMIPLGATEQHGPHLPLGTDWIEADALARAVTSQVDIITTQVIPVGLSRQHMDFPGSITVTRDAYKRFVADICESLIHWGAKRFIFMNQHGGNLDALTEIALDLRSRYGILSAIPQWWEIVRDIDGEFAGAHSGYAETALVAASRPDLVRYDRAQMAPTKPLTEHITPVELTYFDFKGAMIRTYLRVKDLSSIGSMAEELHPPPKPLDLRLASAEVGRRLQNSLVQIIVEFIREFSTIGPFEPEG
jgi:creatinine amidohydrolase